MRFPYPCGGGMGRGVFDSPGLPPPSRFARGAREPTSPTRGEVTGVRGAAQKILYSLAFDSQLSSLARGSRMSAQRRLFLDVEHSVTGRAWRDRLDERTAAGALSIVPRHRVPELLARILAGRGAGLETLEASRAPAVQRLIHPPGNLT